jgi:hypothetical protein
VVVEVMVAVVELVVEAAATDVDGVEDAGRELWPVDGRLKTFYIYIQNPNFNHHITYEI